MMSPAFRVPAGLQQPVGTHSPAAVASPWPLASPAVAGRPSVREIRAVVRALSGVTLAPGDPLRLLLIEDLSGSMTAVAPACESVLRGLLRWARDRLGADDEVGVLSFGGDACVRRAPAPANTKVEFDDPQLSSYATMLGPTWQLVAGFPRTEKPTLAVLISDGLVSDLTGAGGRANAVAAGISDVALLVPSEGSFTGGVPASWTTAFPDASAVVVDSSAAATLATEMVSAVAALTGRAATGLTRPTSQPTST